MILINCWLCAVYSGDVIPIFVENPKITCVSYGFICCLKHLFIKHFSHNADNNNFIKVVIYVRDPTVEFPFGTKNEYGIFFLFTKKDEKEKKKFFLEVTQWNSPDTG